MPSTTALFTGLSGLNANTRSLDVIGNNIANANTTAYKSNRLLFSTQFSRNLSLGGVPGDSNGGSNPAQIGLGVRAAGTQRNFASGPLTATGDSRDLAIEGDGFFIVGRGPNSADQFYTRNGAFRQNAINDLVTISGERLLGYGVDGNFNVVTGSLIPLNIPTGQLRLAEATQNVRFTGNLNAGGTLSSRGARIVFPALSNQTPAPITGATLLTAVDDPNTTGEQPLYAVGDIIEIQGAEKGGKILPTVRLQITATNTVGDLLTAFNAALGIDTTASADPAGFTPGAQIDATTGIITIVGNQGSFNDLRLDTTNLRHLAANGSPYPVASPFGLGKAASADGESVRNTFVVYDSLGNPLNVDVTLVLAGRDNSGTQWRYSLESPGDTDINLLLGSGTIRFDNFGQLEPNQAPITATIDRLATGAVNPLTFTLAFQSPSANVTALRDVRSSVAATFQDGTPLGTLSSFAVGNDGVITGAFTNGLTRTIGQVAVANFANAEGLVDQGNNLFDIGPNSGTPIVTTPTLLGTGRIVGGSLEQSNVDLAQEFINLIQASTGYSASSRVITTTDQLIQQLLAIGR